MQLIKRKPVARRGRKASGLWVDTPTDSGAAGQGLMVVSSSLLQPVFLTLMPVAHGRLGASMTKIHMRSATVVAAVCALLAGCGEDSPGTTPQDLQPTPAGPGNTTPANAPPVISGNPTLSIIAGTSYSFTANASDPNGDPLSFSVAGLPRWANLDFQRGIISGAPTQDDVGESADIVLRVSDGQTTTALPIFRITITSIAAPPPPPLPGNVAPTISGTPSNGTYAGTNYSWTPTAFDPDSPTLVYSIANKPAWASFSATTGTLWGTPTSADVRTFSNIVIAVSDGVLSASLPAFSIGVQAAAYSAPTISGTPGAAVTAGTLYSFTPTAAGQDGLTLTYTVANKPTWATFNAATGRLTGTPLSSNVGIYSNIRVSVSDGTNSVALAPFSIAVDAAPNGSPTISGSPAGNAQVGTAYNFQPSAQDPNGDSLSFSIVNKPSWAILNATTGALTGTPAANHVGSYNNIVISVTDGVASQSLPAYSITVAGVTASNRAPAITGNPSSSGQVGTAYNFQPTAQDADGDSLSFSIANKPSWALFSIATGALTGTPASSHVGAYNNIVISVTDGVASQSLPAYSITVANATPPPSTGSAVLSWSAPTQNTDGSSIGTTIDGYRIYRGTSAGSLTMVVDITDETQITRTIGNLASGTHYFAVSAYNRNNVESAMSAIGSKTIP
jgi:hypothetical protein